MLSKCANPPCSASFRYLHAGKLFRFETRNMPKLESGIVHLPPQSVEFFWLCEDCMQEFTLVSDPVRGVRAVPVRRRSFGIAS